MFAPRAERVFRRSMFAVAISTFVRLVNREIAKRLRIGEGRALTSVGSVIATPCIARGVCLHIPVVRQAWSVARS